MDNIFAKQPSYLRRGRSWLPKPPRPPRPSSYFGLPVMNPSRPPLSPNKPYRWPFNYLKYMKNSNLNAHVKVVKDAIKTNGERKDVNFVNLFSCTLRNIVFDLWNNYMGDYP